MNKEKFISKWNDEELLLILKMINMQQEFYKNNPIKATEIIETHFIYQEYMLKKSLKNFFKILLTNLKIKV